MEAHAQNETKHYRVMYPKHNDRHDDPHQRQFEAYRRAHMAAATCWYADKVQRTDKCGGGLELHHWVVEYAVANEIVIQLLVAEFPDAGATQDEIDAWVQSSPENLIFLCEKHHRSESGVHTVDYANFKSSFVAPDMLP